MLQVRSSRQDISAALSSSVDVTEPVDHMDTTFDMVRIYCTRCSQPCVFIKVELLKAGIANTFADGMFYIIIIVFVHTNSIFE